MVKESWKLPAGFSNYEWKDNEGTTIAHIIAMDSKLSNRLPEDFQGWGWQDKKGNTVAHFRATVGLPLPDTVGLEIWECAADDGRRVIDVAREYNHLALVSAYEQKKLSVTVEEESFCASARPAFSRSAT